MQSHQSELLKAQHLDKEVPKVVDPSRYSMLSRNDQKLLEFVGTYHSDIDGKIQVDLGEKADGTFCLIFLGATLREQDLERGQFRNSGFEFFGGHTGEPVEFIRDERGKVVKLIGYTILHANRL